MKIGFIGCGKMAEAMLASLLASGMASPQRIFGSDVDRERLKRLKKRYGINVCEANTRVAEDAVVLFIAVKPQQICRVLTEIEPVVTNRHLVISIAAGVTIGLMESILKRGRVVRTMPNMACLVSAAATGYALGSRAVPRDRVTVKKLLSCFGDAVELGEEDLDAVTALSGSGPAFFAYCLDSMVDGAVNEGLDRQTALRLATQTMFGTARLLMRRDMDPASLLASVATPNGTTAAGLDVLRKRRAGESIAGTISAAARRCRELTALACKPAAAPSAGGGTARRRKG